MKIEVVRPRELGEAELELWRKIQISNSALDSPFFSPGFAVAVDRIREDSRVAIFRDGGDISGFFPFQQRSKAVGGPIGGSMCDYQGAIVRSEYELSGSQILLGCDLKVLDFSHLIASQSTLLSDLWFQEESPRINLKPGFQEYDAERKRTRRPLVSKRKSNRWRTLEKRRGPIRFEFSTKSGGVLSKVIEWKRNQYERTGALDIFGFDWTGNLLHELFEGVHNNLEGVLSSLYAGNDLIAAHFGIRTPEILHYWFPAYWTEVSEYSPGHLLLVELARSATKNGIESIDLGAGVDTYKTRFSNCAKSVVTGFAGGPSIPSMTRYVSRRVRLIASRLPAGRLRSVMGKLNDSRRKALLK